MSLYFNLGKLARSIQRSHNERTKGIRTDERFCMDCQCGAGCACGCHDEQLADKATIYRLERELKAAKELHYKRDDY